MSMQAVFSCNECGLESVHGRFKGHRSGMTSNQFNCLACGEKRLHSFVRYENDDAEPLQVTEGETEFFFGHNQSDEEGETLLAFEDLPEETKKAIQQRKGKQMKAPQPVSTAAAPRKDDSARVQFFSVDRLAGVEQTVKIKTVEFVQSNYGDVSFTLEMNGRPYLWDRKLNSNAYGVIIAAFGDETDNWIGKELLARPVYNAKFKQTEVQVEAKKAAKAPTAKR